MPESFARQGTDATYQVELFYDPGSAQATNVISNFIDKYLTQANYSIAQIKPAFPVQSSPGGPETEYELLRLHIGRCIGTCSYEWLRHWDSRIDGKIPRGPDIEENYDDSPANLEIHSG
jgi:hypothetical protein